MPVKKTTWVISVALILLCLTSLMGCSGSGSPTSPAVDPGIMDNSSSDRTSSSDYTNNRGCWGWWQVYIDTETLDVNIEPLRSAAFTCNITKFMQPPISPIHMLSITIDPTGSDFPNGILDVEVTLNHPFLGFNKFRGFDVRGIFMADLGALDLVTDEHDPSLLYNPWDGPRLLNADGYSRWWNYQEFTTYGTIFGYTPAAFAVPNDGEWHSRLNPYKYFTDELDIDDVMSIDPANRGTFSTIAGVNSRDYLIQFGMDTGSPIIQFTYAIDTSWSLPDPAYEPEYPIEAYDLLANCQEAYQISVSTYGTTLWYVDPLGGSGTLHLEIEVFDWQSPGNPLGVPGEVSGIYLSSDIGGIDDIDITSLTVPTLGTGPTSSIWTVDLIDLEPYPPTNDYNRILVTVESENPNTYAPDLPDPSGFDYPDAPLAAFQWVLVPIADEPPPPEILIIIPNGGEVWSVGAENDIEWMAPPSVSDVMLEYSKDGFTADIIEIIDTTPNDGSFTWTIPNDPSETVRVRVSEVGNPTYNDISDEDFEIIFDDCTPVFTEKWSYQLPDNGYVDTMIRGGITIADLDDDGTMETLVFGGIIHRLFCFDHEGGIEWDYTCGGVSDWYGAPSVGEFNDDGILDVVMSNMDGDLYVMNGADGSLIMSINAPLNFNSCASLADVVGETNDDPPDGQLDFFLGRYDDPELYNTCYNGATGNLVWESRRSGWGYSVPCLADMDLDSDIDPVCVGGYYDIEPNTSGINVLRGDANATERLIWEADHGSNILNSPVLHDWTGDGIPDIFARDYSAHTAQCFDGSDGTVLWEQTGIYSQVGSSALGDLNGDGFPDIVVGRNPAPGVFTAYNGDPDASERILWNWTDPYNTMDARTSPILCDVTCDGIPDVIASMVLYESGVDNYGRLWIIDGETGEGITYVEFVSDQVLFGAPAVGDIDGDGETDVVVGTHDHGWVYAYGLGTPWPDNHEARPWPMYGGNIRNTCLYGDEF